MSPEANRTPFSAQRSPTARDVLQNSYELLRNTFLSEGPVAAARNPHWNSFTRLGLAGLVQATGANDDDAAYVLHADQVSRPWWSRGPHQGDKALLDVFRQLTERLPMDLVTSGASVTQAGASNVRVERETPDVT